jgi:prepilin-type N-terminal cleavage/methylation domain-containing protein
MNARGFSLAELLVSMAVVLILLVAVSAAIVQTLHVQAFHAGRASMSRSVSDLSERLREEARSATAVFVPSVDFFRRQSDDGDAFVAYRFDGASGDVTRYEYSTLSGAKVVTVADVAASDIAAFSVLRETAGTAGGTLAGASDPPSVTISYGTPELTGGNDVVVAGIQPRGRDSIPGPVALVHLASRVAPTAVAVLAPTGVPTSPPGTKVFPFIILRPGFPVTPPHGPLHGGSPGGPGSFLHWVAAAGSVQFFGSSETAAGDWFELSAMYARAGSGVYSFHAADGSSVTALISCTGGPCPSFKPLPVSAPGLTPAGSVAFRMMP